MVANPARGTTRSTGCGVGQARWQSRVLGSRPDDEERRAGEDPGARLRETACAGLCARGCERETVNATHLSNTTDISPECRMCAAVSSSGSLPGRARDRRAPALGPTIRNGPATLLCEPLLYAQNKATRPSRMIHNAPEIEPD